MIPDQPSPKVAMLGLPSDENSSFMRGPAMAPPRIREALYSESANAFSEDGTDLQESDWWLDYGDLHLTYGEEARDTISGSVADLLDQGMRVLSLGGDHSVTYPIMRAYGEKFPELTIVQIDAHGDLYDELDGNRFSHACPFARIMEDKLATRLIQIGIRAMTAFQWQQVERFGVRVIPAWAYQLADLQTLDLDPDTPVYLSLDLDGLDPAFAPGVSHHEPGGLSTRDVLQLIKLLPGRLVGADVVELNPHRDLVDMTAMVAAKCVKELLVRISADT